MKKLYILLLAGASALGANAAELTFYIGDQKIENGSTVYFSDYQAEEFESGWWDITMAPKLSLESSFFTNAVTVTATCTSGHTVQMCCGGLCSDGKTVTKKNLTINTGERLDLEFEYLNTEYEGTAVPDVITKFTASDNGGTPVEFTLVMGPSAASVDNVATADKVAFTGSSIEYSFSGPTALAVYSLTGTCVISDTLRGSGAVSTANLPKGVYIYKAGKETGKILVK